MWRPKKSMFVEDNWPMFVWTHHFAMVTQHLWTFYGQVLQSSHYRAKHLRPGKANIVFLLIHVHCNKSLLFCPIEWLHLSYTRSAVPTWSLAIAPNTNRSPFVWATTANFFVRREPKYGKLVARVHCSTAKSMQMD